MLVPFDSNGNMERCWESYMDPHRDEYTWEPDNAFYAVMEIKAVYGIRSGFEAVLSNNDRKMYMNGTEFESMVRKAKISNGVVEGTWIIKKKGAYYSLAYIG